MATLSGLYVCLWIIPEVKKQYPGKRFDVDYDKKNDIYQKNAAMPPDSSVGM